MPPTSRPQVISISPASAAHGRGDGASAPLHEAPRWVQALVTLLLIALIVGAVAIAGALALAHARDRHWINIASGSWIALGWHAEHGALYPPLRDDAGTFGGTRYMPLHILLHAGLRHAIGSRASNAEAWLVSGRAIAFASALAWALAIIALARMGEIFAEQLDRHRSAGPGFAGRDDVSKGMPGVVALGMLAAGRDNGGATDRHSFAVGAAPVAIDRVRERRTGKSQQRGAYRCGQQAHSSVHDTTPLQLPLHGVWSSRAV